MTGHASLVTLGRRPDGVALVTIDNPPVNALTTPLFAQLLAITEELTVSPPGAVVLAGQQKVFALGGEISPAPLTWPGHSPPAPGPRRPASSG